VPVEGVWVQIPPSAPESTEGVLPWPFKQRPACCAFPCSHPLPLVEPVLHPGMQQMFWFCVVLATPQRMYQCNYLPTAHQLSIFCCGRKFSTVAVENFLPLHCEPFAGEAIPDLSGQIDRLGIASSQRALLAMTCTNGFDDRLNSYLEVVTMGVLFPWPCSC
jgi:hypothetical protein